MKLALVGKIIATHGIKGELKIKSETSFADERYKKGSKLYLGTENKNVIVEITSHRTHKGFDLITINNLTDINLVLQYVGSNLYIDVNQLDDLEDGSFYYSQLIGLEVYNSLNENVGIVEDIQEVPQGIILRIKEKNNKTALIPFVQQFIKEIDLEQNRIYIDEIEGLL